MTDLFEAKASDWDANERRTRMSAAIGAAIEAQVRLHDRMAVLDFGAGTGLLSARIAPLVKRVVAVDTSRAMLDQLMAKPELKEKVEAVCRDIVEEPLDDKFDLIVSAMTLHHVDNTAGLLQALRAHLKNTGRLALADLDEEDGSFHPAGTQGIFHSGFDRARLGSMIESAGFEQVEFTTAHTMNKEGRDYPIFLATARKA